MKRSRNFERKFRLWDLRAKILAPIMTALGILVSVLVFLAGEYNLQKREQEARKLNDTYEFKRRFWSNQLEAYQETAKLSGNMAATLRTGKKFDSLIHEFYVLYHGNMILFEDSLVIQAMKNMNREIKAYQTKTSSILGGFTPEQRIIRASEYLNEQLRTSSQKTWHQLNQQEYEK